MRFGGISILAAALLVTGLVGCAKFRAEPVRILHEGTVNRGVEQSLLDLASVRDFAGEDNPGPALMQQIADNDRVLMKRFMHALGYYDTSIRAEIPATTGETTIVNYVLDPGPLYQLDEITLSWPEYYTGRRPDPAGFANGAATTRAIEGIKNRIQSDLREHGYPAAEVTIHEVIVDHATRLVDAKYAIQPGNFARFGNLNTEGFRKIRTSYAYKAQPWKKGEIYRESLVDEMERRMAAGGVFSTIDLQHDPRVAKENDEDYHLTLQVRERPPRTIQFGTGYRTDTGAEVSARWQHRNALGGGENFTLRAKWSESGQEAETRISVPFFRRGDQRWSTGLTFAREDTDAYESESYKGESLITREVSPTFTIRGGLALRYLDEQQSGASDYFYLGSIPARFLWDHADQTLDATRGYRLLVSSEPFQSLKDNDRFFWKNLASLNSYVPLRRDRALSLALRVTAGSLNAETLGDVPAELRFFAGGAQSVRGYAYQSLSPRDAAGELMGGLSLAESSLELRARFGSRFGAVAFVDGGAAYTDKIPDLEEDFRWGAGLGFRYFTRVGPVRLDAAFPLDRRDGIDDAWQFYVSLGQSF
jgi:translocation and assembly module TamA